MRKDRGACLQARRLGMIVQVCCVPRFLCFLSAFCGYVQALQPMHLTYRLLFCNWRSGKLPDIPCYRRVCHQTAGVYHLFISSLMPGNCPMKSLFGSPLSPLPAKKKDCPFTQLKTSSLHLTNFIFQFNSASFSYTNCQKKTHLHDLHDHHPYPHLEAWWNPTDVPLTGGPWLWGR